MQASASRSSSGTSPSRRRRSSPKRIFRWTSRKKIITGTAITVDAAISAPQSVCRAEPEKYESQTVTVCFD